jgi:hypothetical protein
MRAVSVLVTFCARNSGGTNEPQDQLAASNDTEILEDYIDRELRRRTNSADANVDNSQTQPQSDRS